MQQIKRVCGIRRCGYRFRFVAVFDVRHHLDFGAADQARGSHHFAGSIAFDGRLGILDFAYDDGGQFYRNGVALRRR